MKQAIALVRANPRTAAILAAGDALIALSVTFIVLYATGNLG